MCTLCLADQLVASAKADSPISLNLFDSITSAGVNVDTWVPLQLFDSIYGDDKPSDVKRSTAALGLRFEILLDEILPSMALSEDGLTTECASDSDIIGDCMSQSGSDVSMPSLPFACPPGLDLQPMYVAHGPSHGIDCHLCQPKANLLPNVPFVPGGFQDSQVKTLELTARLLMRGGSSALADMCFVPGGFENSDIAVLEFAAKKIFSQDEHCQTRAEFDQRCAL